MHSKLVKHLIFPLHEKIMGRDTYKFLDRLEKEQFLGKKASEKLKFQKLKRLNLNVFSGTIYGGAFL
ncbi:hypothetical protein [Desulfobacter sp.]|uniref:hypothetical protein n=1 Tax=Desulfobacter sp. TaxID=2294 RepID=UPI000E9E98B0|nr:hypothetical protein [Desulfobacter sp.]HBT88997.1 hypothetical protein [Desulfobacter sp.]